MQNIVILLFTDTSLADEVSTIIQTAKNIGYESIVCSDSSSVVDVIKNSRAKIVIVLGSITLSSYGEEILSRISSAFPEVTTITYKNDGVAKTLNNKAEVVYELASKGYVPDAVVPVPLDIKIVENLLSRLIL